MEDYDDLILGDQDDIVHNVVPPGREADDVFFVADRDGQDRPVPGSPVQEPLPSRPVHNRRPPDRYGDWVT